jgi:5-bromo-4-chloroindolyl phosphate hydrolysis protein
MDDQFLYALLYFFGGAFTYAVLSRLLLQANFIMFARDMLHMFLKMLGALSLEIATARAAKYEMLEQAGYTEKEIEAVKSIDRLSDASWKMALINALINSFPKKYRQLVTFYDWDGAMKALQNIYSKERKRYEKE